MSLLVVGMSHRTAPIALLEQVALSPEGALELAAAAHRREDVAEAIVVATCNRTEVYVDAHTFHGGLAQVGESLAEVTGVPLDTLTDHLYVHYEDRAVSHLFSLACGLESMAVGESQVLGQLRESLASAQQQAHVGPSLNPLFQHALRVGKRAHTDTAIDEVSRSLVQLGLDRARTVLPDPRQARTVLVGAGAMSGLAAATLARVGVTDLTVVNRTRERAERLAATHGGRAAGWEHLAELVGAADLVLTCTGSVGHVLRAEQLAPSRAGRSQPLAVIDLALPRDVADDVAALPGVHVWGLSDLTGQPDGAGPAVPDAAAAPTPTDSRQVLQQVQDLVTGEVAAYLTERRAQQVGPTVAALRARAADVVDAEVERLAQRLPELPQREQQEVRRTVQRVVDKLLHTPTVRVKQLVSDDRGDYADALRQLFDLDSRETATVSTPPRLVPPRGEESA
ncbi:glutamyl-tRNA reductase [Ornithinicoccus halotolerans]|uniref:glutamyl-tRNA reductase n=1 Tax=Ornithinicoccus halotolerans TaxID=1748220 RepID=UPI001294AEF2|nr:glutamyl-tRNA reductase [Ornithinicoccus halotolerans]